MAFLTVDQERMGRECQPENSDAYLRAGSDSDHVGCTHSRCVVRGLPRGTGGGSASGMVGEYLYPCVGHVPAGRGSVGSGVWNTVGNNQRNVHFEEIGRDTSELQSQFH